MDKQTFVATDPIYVGFVGPAGSGKTSTARDIVPPSTIASYDDPNMFPRLIWDHHWLSLPLYEIHNIRTQTTGIDKENRILHGIHDIVTSVFMNTIPFNDMIELIYDLYSLPIDPSEDKPRSFLQQAGDLFVNAKKDCFAQYTKRKIHSLWSNVSTEYDRHDVETPWYIAIVSDIRFPHEAEVFHSQPNHLLINLTCDLETRNQRLLERDGVLLTSSQSTHRTENSIDSIPKEWYDIEIDTTVINQEYQAQLIKGFILNQNFYSDSMPLHLKEKYYAEG